MIVLNTGLPGDGKTLLTIQRIKEIAEADPDNERPVYYHGIVILDHAALPWIHLDDPKKWYECPPNSIVFIDEAQSIFRPTSPSATLPEYITRMETHRHGGIDVYLITQRPKLIHAHVRELAGRHHHVVRKFGMQKAVVHTWTEAQDNTKLRKDSSKQEVKYPKHIYKWYKSAEVHTHKRKLPASYYLMWMMPIIAIALGAYGAYRLWHVSDHAKQPNGTGAPVVAPPLPGTMQAPPGGRMYKQTVQEWLDDRKPRIPDLAYSAPAYDDVTKPTVAPYPAACVVMRGQCRCYSQQGTRLATGDQMCREVVANGYFVDWEPRQGQGGNVDRQQRVETPQPVQVASGEPSMSAGVGRIAWVKEQPLSSSKPAGR